MRGLDVGPPIPSVRLPEFHRDTTLDVSWSATDDWSPIGSYEFRYTVKKWNRKGVVHSTWRSTGSISTSTMVRDGGSYCVSVRATDVVGRTSDGDDTSCTTTPLDDRALERRGGWKKSKGAGYYDHTYLGTRKQGAVVTLSLIHI